MRSFLAVWRLFIRRGASNWPLLAVLGLGVLIAATLLAAAPVYSRTMSDLGLTFTIRDQLEETPSTRVLFLELPLQTRDGAAFRSAVEQRIDERLGWFRDSQARYFDVGRFAISVDGAAPEQRAPLLELQSLAGFESHVRVASGRLPQAPAPGGPLEFVMTPATATIAKLKPGDQFVLNENFDSCERKIPTEDPPPPPIPCQPSVVAAYTATAVLVGIIEPLNANDPFWPIGPGQYLDASRRIPDVGPVVPALTSEDTVLGVFGALHRGYRPTTEWNVFADPDSLSRSNFLRARDDILGLYNDSEPYRGYAYSPLTTTLTTFDRAARHGEVPLTILLLEIAAVALFYVLLMSTVIVERQAAEIALLRSRGATILQVLSVYLMDGLLLGIPALLVAPLLAASATALLGLAPVFRDVSGGDLLPAQTPLSAFLMAAAGVVLAIITLLVPAFVVARRSSVSQKRAEARPGPGFIQRYYLDLILAGFAALLLWELRERGSVFTPSSSVGVSSDPLLLASPALIIAASAALILRFVPMVLRLGTRLVSGAAGVSLAVGLWQVVRNPGQYTRLALLLMMAVAVGTFAASYSSTADRSYRDRARYESGVDWRAASTVERGLGADGEAADTALKQLPGVEAVSAVMRVGGALATPGTSSQRIQVLGLNPEYAARALWSRHDFADQPLSELIGLLGVAGELGGRTLPGDPTDISIWIYTAQPRADTTVWARVRDKNHSYALLELGNLNSSGWRQITGKVHREFGVELEAPIVLTSFVITEPSNRPSLSNNPLYIDDISVTPASGQEVVIEDFEGVLRWSPIPGRIDLQDQLESSKEQHRGGAQSAKYTFKRGSGSGLRGFHVVDRHTPLPAIISQSFSDQTGIRPGGIGLLQIGEVTVPIAVRGVYDLFPTLQTREGPSVVLNRDHLASFLALTGSSYVAEFNEAWFQLAPDADRDALAKTLGRPEFGLTTTFDQQKSLDRIDRNPLIAAGGSGILFLAFLALLTLVAVALLVSLWTAVQRRRAEFAVLRSMGLSRVQVFWLLAVEYTIVAVIGLVAGCYLGLLVGRQMLSFLDVNEDGAHVEPSFILQTDWSTVIAGGGVIVLGFLAALVLAVGFLSRTSDAVALRRE